MLIVVAIGDLVLDDWPLLILMGCTVAGMFAADALLPRTVAAQRGAHVRMMETLDAGETRVHLRAGCRSGSRSSCSSRRTPAAGVSRWRSSSPTRSRNLRSPSGCTAAAMSSPRFDLVGAFAHRHATAPRREGDHHGTAGCAFRDHRRRRPGAAELLRRALRLGVQRRQPDELRHRRARGQPQRRRHRDRRRRRRLRGRRPAASRSTSRCPTSRRRSRRPKASAAPASWARSSRRPTS